MAVLEVIERADREGNLLRVGLSVRRYSQNELVVFRLGVGAQEDAATARPAAVRDCQSEDSRIEVEHLVHVLDGDAYVTERAYAGHALLRSSRTPVHRRVLPVRWQLPLRRGSYRASFAHILTVVMGSRAFPRLQVVEHLHQHFVWCFDVNRVAVGLRIVDAGGPIDLDAVVLGVAEVATEGDAMVDDAVELAAVVLDLPMQGLEILERVHPE